MEGTDGGGSDEKVEKGVDALLEVSEFTVRALPTTAAGPLLESMLRISFGRNLRTKKFKRIS
jgi:hypothetical protein